MELINPPHGVMVIVEEIHSNPINNRILFVREAVTKAWKIKGQLSVPSGIIDDQEWGPGVAARELQEETSLIVQPEQIYIRGNFRMNITGEGIDGIQTAFADVFKAVLTPEQVQEQNIRIPEGSEGEISEIKWLTRKQIFTLAGKDLRPGNMEALLQARNANYSQTINIHNGRYDI